MNCGRVFFAESEEGWSAGVNANRRRKAEKNATSFVSLASRDILKLETRAILVCNTVKKVIAMMILIARSV